jgi:CheY-like chemotaxis protein
VALILVVDDDPAVRRALERVLQSRGHQVLLAADGRQGLRIWRERGADLVLLDIHMPDMDGIEVLVQLRGLAPRLPVIVMSGGDQTRSLDLLGMPSSRRFGVLKKPFTLNEVVGVVDRADWIYERRLSGYGNGLEPLPRRLPSVGHGPAR